MMVSVLWVLVRYLFNALCKQKWRNISIWLCWFNEHSQFLRRNGIINTGFRRGQTVCSCSKDGQRKKYDYDTESDPFQRCVYDRHMLGFLGPA